MPVADVEIGQHGDGDYCQWIQPLPVVTFVDVREDVLDHATFLFEILGFAKFALAAGQYGRLLMQGEGSYCCIYGRADSCHVPYSLDPMVLCRPEVLEVSLWHLGDEVPIADVSDIGAVVVEQSASKRPVNGGDAISWDGESDVFDIFLGGLVATVGWGSVMLLSLATSRRCAGAAGGRGRCIAVGILKDLQQLVAAEGQDFGGV